LGHYIISHQFIHFKIEINTSLPLAPGFYMPYNRSEPHWIMFKYKRLDNYCTNCGLIGHKKGVCPAPQKLFPFEKYKKSLKTLAYVSPRMVSKC
jgi:hypothetical protein